jgi:hypothetical protein
LETKIQTSLLSEKRIRGHLNGRCKIFARYKNFKHIRGHFRARIVVVLPLGFQPNSTEQELFVILFSLRLRIV